MAAGALAIRSAPRDRSEDVRARVWQGLCSRHAGASNTAPGSVGYVGWDVRGRERERARMHLCITAYSRSRGFLRVGEAVGPAHGHGATDGCAVYGLIDDAYGAGVRAIQYVDR